MIDLYTWKTPNGRKISIMLEEIGMPYTVKPVDFSTNDQQKPEYVAFSPNARIPAIIDHTETGDIAIFESAAILIYLAEKSGQLLAPAGAARYSALAWLSWQVSAISPMFGQLGFFARQKERNEPAIERYLNETIRLLKVLETRLAASPYLAGAEYSIADISAYPWIAGALGMMGQMLPEEVRTQPATTAWLAGIGARPAVQKGLAVPA